MSQFTKPLQVDLIGVNKWQLLESFEYHVGSYPSKNIIRAPLGFVTDFASIPRLFWNILPPQGMYGKAAVIHDWCYWSACFDRKKSDKIFLEGMKALKVKRWRYALMYSVVRCFAFGAWNMHRKEKHECITKFKLRKYGGKKR